MLHQKRISIVILSKVDYFCCILFVPSILVASFFFSYDTFKNLCSSIAEFLNKPIWFRHELRDYGVDVISVEPGIYCTPLNAIERTMKAMNATWARASNELREEYGEYWFSRGSFNFHFIFSYRDFCLNKSIISDLGINNRT